MKKVGLIVHFGEDFLAYRINFLKYLQSSNYEAFTIVPNDEYKTEIQKTRIITYFYKYKKSWMAIFYVFSTVFQIKNILEKEKPDILFTYKFFPNLIGIYVADKLKVKKIIGTVAGLGFLSKYDKSFFIKTVFILYLHILNKAHYIIVQNREDEEVLSKYIDKEKLLLTDGSGVNKSNFVLKNGCCSREYFTMKEGYKYFLFCTRIVREKGIFELIEAFNGISQKGLRAGLVIAGWFDDKSLELKTVNKIKNNDMIVYLGYQKDVQNLIDLCDCVILPSYYPEGIPRSLTEALALSKPIITTDHRGCRETCMDGVNGFLVKARDARDLEEKMFRFLGMNDEEIQKMSTSSYELFRRRFDQDVVFKVIADKVL